MSPEQIDRVFGRGRLRMVTGEHVEVFREAVLPGERRRYTKRFLNSNGGDFAQWTEREWRILARLIGHGVGCVPDVVQFDRGSVSGAQLVQTYDAGVTVDQWATLLPLVRDGRVYRHAFEDCAHWWALAHHCLVALKEIHQLQLVHLDIKGDNVCIPLAPAEFDPDDPAHSLHPLFGQLALIDFAFSLVSGENLTAPLPIGRQLDYDYQSPRLLAALEAGHGGDLRPTRELDWRCDIYSLAAMLGRYLPEDVAAQSRETATGWTSDRHGAAKALIATLRDHHDRDAPQRLPHPELIELTGARLGESDLALSLTARWTLARDVSPAFAAASPVTPMTRIAPPIRVFRKPREHAPIGFAAPAGAPEESSVPLMVTKRDTPVRPRPARQGAARFVLGGLLVAALGVAVAFQMFPDVTRGAIADAQSWFTGATAMNGLASSATATGAPRGERASTSGDGPPTSSVNEAAAPPAAAPASADADADADADKVPATPPAAEAVPTEDPKPAPAIAAPNEVAPRPPVPKASSKPAPSAGETARSRRSPAKSPSAATAGMAPPTASARTPAPRTASLPPRAAPSNPRNAPAASSAPSSRAEVSLAAAPAPVIVAQLEPPRGEAARAPSPPVAPQSAEPVAPPGPPVQAAPPPSAADAPPSATPKSTAPPRKTRTPSAADDLRAGFGALSQLLGFTKRKAAPIEDRTLADATPSAKAPRAPQAAAAVPEQPAPVRPKVELPAVTASNLPPPPVVSPWPAVPEARSPDRARDADFATQARRTLAQTVPRVAVQAQAEIAHVLWAAANALDPRQERDVVDSAQAIWVSDGAIGPSQVTEPAAARRLNDEAMQAYRVRRNVAEAFDLSLKAFGANPGDPEIAGNLAFLHLRLSPAQPETARQLALHAIAVRGPRFRTGRLEDWNTYALASAMTGRDADARNAMYVTMALAGSVDRNCKAGLSAIAHYGDRVREPVEAMLYRIYTQGRATESPYCAWPPSWAVGMRRP